MLRLFWRGVDYWFAASNSVNTVCVVKLFLHVRGSNHIQSACTLNWARPEAATRSVANGKRNKEIFFKNGNIEKAGRDLVKEGHHIPITLIAVRTKQ